MDTMNYGFTDIVTLLGSLGLFLCGMKVMCDAIMEVAEDKMCNIFASMTFDCVFAVFSGLFISSFLTCGCQFSKHNVAALNNLVFFFDHEQLKDT